MKSRFRLTQRAVTDVENIADFTLKRWGAAQMETYVRGLYCRFDWLAENPDLGRRRSDLVPGLQSYQEGSHVIFYRLRDDWIEIIGVLHQAMDVEAWFEELPDEEGEL